MMHWHKRSFLLLVVASSSALALEVTNNRRRLIQNTFATLATTTATTAAARAASLKSRTDGYAVQHTGREWAYILSGAQYNILREGGTERQKSSILNTFTTANVGTYTCAGCDTPLFSSADKFSSNTGWPSFASALDGVEVEDLDSVRATLDGREVRCRTCGGHLGDLFNDGWLYVGSTAAKTGKRYCIDGSALIFKPVDGGEEVFGDVPSPNKVIMYEAAQYREPRTTSK
jgi:peptide-methionine (R)-S-oxide reductase